MNPRTHPVIKKINKKVDEKYKYMCKKELESPYGRCRSIDGVICVHPDRDTQITEMCEKYRIELLEAYILEHC